MIAKLCFVCSQHARWRYRWAEIFLCAQHAVALPVVPTPVHIDYKSPRPPGM